MSPGRHPRYELMSEALRAQPNEWLKISPESLNGKRYAINKSLEVRLGEGNVQVKNKKLDIYARYLTLARIEDK